MSTLRSPVGPLPPSVYWRRRILVLLGIAAVVVVIVLLVVGRGDGAPDAGSTGSPAPTDTTGPTDTPNPDPTFTSAAGGEECNPAQIRLVAVTDSNSYASGKKPMISMTITNAGSAPCTFDVGTAAQEYLITSGSDRIWSSKDCQTEPQSSPQVLEPGVELSTTPFAWDRTRSSTTTCDGSRPAAVAGPDGPTYRLQVKLGSVESEQTAFRLY
ncbi:MAG: hypothetical protein KF727_09770 [Microbacteriaceae bacterium]|nr:hypothetical protein [Microbacteriaceae bacterium]